MEFRPFPPASYRTALGNFDKRISFDKGGRLERMPPARTDMRTPPGLANRPSAMARNRQDLGIPDTISAADTSQGGGRDVPDKKPRACLNCRRSKHRCLPSSDPNRCVRCSKRNEECKFKSRLHDDEWQDWVTDELKAMQQTIDGLRSTIDDLRNGSVSRSLVSAQTVHEQHIGQTHASRLPVSPRIQPAPSRSSLRQPMSSSLREAMFSPELDMQAEYADSRHDSFDSPSHGPLRAASLSLAGSESRDAQQRSFAVIPTAALHMDSRASTVIPEPPLFMSIASAATLLSELGSGTRSAPGELQFTNDELGSNDPRPNIIHKGVVEPRSCNILFEYFVENVSPMLPGFTLRDGEYPFLPTGRSTITPYVLSVMTLIAAERLPAFHEKVSPLTMETSLACPLSLSVTAEPHMEGVYEQGGSESEPFFNVELGIGPEEIIGMSLKASFCLECESHVAAKAALEWARGFAKGDEGQATRVLTLGEMCGYLSPRRWPTKSESNRLILFTFVIAVQQSIYRAARLPRFSPSDICDELSWASRTDEEIVRDNVLIAHVRLGMILQAWQNATSSPHADTLRLVDDYNRYLDQFLVTLDQAGIAAEHRDLLAPIWLYARIIINMAGSNTMQQSNASLCTRNAMRAARSLLDVFGSPKMTERLPLLPPFLIEIYSLGCTLLLMRMSKLVQKPTAGEDEMGELMPKLDDADASVLDAIDTAARRLLQGPLPSGHFAPMAGERLQTAVLGIKQRWRT